MLGGRNGFNDILIASIGDDTVYGDSGDDRIEGGDGNDILIGGTGDDSSPTRVATTYPGRRW